MGLFILSSYPEAQVQNALSRSSLQDVKKKKINVGNLSSLKSTVELPGDLLFIAKLCGLPNLRFLS